MNLFSGTPAYRTNVSICEECPENPSPALVRIQGLIVFGSQFGEDGQVSSRNGGKVMMLIVKADIQKQRIGPSIVIVGFLAAGKGVMFLEKMCSHRMESIPKGKADRQIHAATEMEGIVKDYVKREGKDSVDEFPGGDRFTPHHGPNSIHDGIDGQPGELVKEGASNISKLPIQGHIGIFALRALIRMMIAVVTTKGHGNWHRGPHIAEQSSQLVGKGAAREDRMTTLVHTNGQQIYDAPANHTCCCHHGQPPKPALCPAKHPCQEYMIGHSGDNNGQDHGVLDKELPNRGISGQHILPPTNVGLGDVSVPGKVVILPCHRSLPCSQVEFLGIKGNGRFDEPKLSLESAFNV